MKLGGELGHTVCKHVHCPKWTSQVIGNKLHVNREKKSFY